MENRTLENARELMCTGRKVVGAEEIPVYESAGRILAEDIVATINQPPFPRSAMDGYALKWEDTKGASEQNPIRLQVSAKVCAGDAPVKLENQKEAVRIMTGGMIPEGADCVIRQEDTDYGEEEVVIYCEGMRNQNCCPAGEDFLEGEKLAEAGAVIDAYTVAVAVSTGRGTVKVRRKVRTAIISTGDELCQPGEKLVPGKIYDSNMAYLTASLSQKGCRIIGACAAGDSEKEIRAALEKFLPEADLIITTGGVSVGEKDLLLPILEKMDAEVVFHGISVKPGMPTLFSVVKDTPVLSLSGNPYSASAVFELLGAPMIAALQGKKKVELETRTAVLATEFPKKSPCRRILRGFYDGRKVSSSMMQRNGQIKAGVGSNCLVEIPAGSGAVKEGETVTIYLL